MRVALISHNARMGDAIGNLVAAKLEVFLERGADVRVFLESPMEMHPRVRPHAQVIRAEATGPAWDFLANSDLVCVEFGQWYSLLGLLPLLCGGKPRILLDYHSITPPEFLENNQREALGKGRQQRGLAWAADLVVFHSRFTYRELVEATGIPEERLCRLGFPIDLQRFHPGFRQSAFGCRPSAEHREPNAEARILLFVGRLAPNKRVSVLVEALGRLRDLDPPVHAVIVGDISDVYRAEADRCRQLARDLRVEDRLHFLGHVSDESLAEAYRSADAFVMPSLWEGFCIPVLEAMASGVPVVAARTGALPETVADAGLTFQPDDAEDLARQIRRILPTSTHSPLTTRHSPLTTHHSPKRVAIVSMRYGDGFAGGAEWSLRRMATALCLAGHGVEVFTTCTRSENDWKNDLPAGTSHDGTTLVHRFRLGPHDRGRHLDAVRAIHEASGKVPPEIAQAYLDHSLHSPDLIEALRHRQNDFAAIIVGPYLFGLTWDVAREFPGKTLLVPCFHDEPIARLAAWPEAYERVAGILYHSREEQELAQTDLGLNHPHSLVIGTWLSEERGSAGARSALRAPALPRRYVVYCGRYSAHKELPKLLDYARCYYEQHPDRFTFVFMGQGEVAIPAEPWARDLGYVSVEEKSRVLADAAALIQLSYFESLSLVALEAWSAGTPIIAAKKCAVLAGHIASSGGGQTVTDYTDFAAAVDDLWNQPAAWKLRGLAGQDYVRATYGSLETFQNRLWEALAGMDIPLAERMRQQGLKRAALFRAAAWREQFSNLVEKTLDAPPLPQRHEVEIVPYQQENRSSPGGSLLIGVRLTNRGTHPLLGEGPGLTKLCCQVRDGQTQEPVGPIMETPLPGILPPGQATPAAMALQAPEKPGSYQVVIWTERPGKHCRLQIADCKLKDASFLQSAICNLQSAISLVVDGSERNLGLCAPLLEAVQAVLAQAHRLQRLPDDYIDVSEGFLARCKRWLKRKLLNNFKRAYVDVLSRQQTQVNQQLVHAVQELAQCCASLDHAVRVLNEKLARLEKGETGTVVIGETALESGKPAKE